MGQASHPSPSFYTVRAFLVDEVPQIVLFVYSAFVILVLVHPNILFLRVKIVVRRFLAFRLELERRVMPFKSMAPYLEFS